VKAIAKIVLYLIATVVLAPPLYWSGQAILQYGAQHGWVALHTDHGQTVATGHLAFLAQKFRRYFDRAILISAFALLWPLARSLKITNWSGLNLSPDPRRWQHFLIGLLLSILSVVILGLLAITSGSYTLLPAIPWEQIALLPLGAIVVALLEEWLFRGAIQGVLQRSTSNFISILFVSALYAIVHFLNPPDHAVAQTQITWASGFIQTTLAFWQFREPALVLGGFSTLFLVGVILAYARLRTRSLWLPVGLHTGWIIAKMGFNQIAHHQAASAGLWFGPDLLTGLAPVLAVLTTGAIVWWCLNPLNEKSIH
jgi:membrane protease YdiL (CAAX protease family)